MTPYRINPDTFTDLNEFIEYLRFSKLNNIPLTKGVVCDIDDLRCVLDSLPFGSTRSTNAKDLFVESLAQLNDTGDIDVLVRYLSWQQHDISFLVSQLVSYERNLTKLDEALKLNVKLKNDIKRLRVRNAELSKLVSSLKSYHHEKKN